MALVTCPNANWALNADFSACVPTGATVTCGSTDITISVHVDHLYADLDPSYYSSANVVFGTCTDSTVTPDENGMITDTFDIEACGGTWSQTGAILVDFEVKGDAAAISTTVGSTTIELTSVLSFDAHCEYSSTASLTTSHSVDSDDAETVDIEDDTGDFTDKFSLQWYSADTRTEADNTTPTLGDTVYLQAASSLAINHKFYLNSCTASKGGTSIALLDHCNQDDTVVSALRLVNPGLVDTSTLDWSFTAFAITGQEAALDIACEVSICALAADDTQLDENCGVCAEPVEP